MNPKPDSTLHNQISDSQPLHKTPAPVPHPQEQEKQELVEQGAVAANTVPGQMAITGASLIAAERQRQITKEGYTHRHDDEHDAGDLAVAGMCYAAYAGNLLKWWPWDEEWWKPTDDPIRSLTKAGALIAAEIDRALRLKSDSAPSLEQKGRENI